MAVQNKPILFISPLPPPQGGIAIWTKKIVSTGLPDGTPVTLVNTKIRGKRNIFDAVFLSFAELYRTLHIMLAVSAQLLFQRPKLIHINCSLSAVGVFRDAACVTLARLLRIPVVMHYHGNLQDFSSQRFFGMSAMVLRYLLRKAQANIVINKPSFEKAQTVLPATKPPLLLPNFTDDHLFSLKKIASTHPRHKAIFGGGITQAKGCEEILAAAHALPDVEFHLYGKMHADLDEKCRTAPTNVFLHGEVRHAALIEAMQQSDFLIFPSYSEGFPLTVVEAMSLGLPVIATTVGAIPEMITDGAGGYLIAPRNAAALIAAIRELTREPQQLTAMGDFNRKKSYTDYRFSVVIKRLLTIYNAILEPN